MRSIGSISGLPNRKCVNAFSSSFGFVLPYICALDIAVIFSIFLIGDFLGLLLILPRRFPIPDSREFSIYLADDSYIFIGENLPPLLLPNFGDCYNINPSSWLIESD